MSRTQLLFLSALSTACYGGRNDGATPRGFDDLQQAYQAKAGGFDQCLDDFTTCVDGVADPTGIVACSDELQSCLAGGLGGGSSGGGGSDSGGGSSGSGGSDSGGGSSSGGSDSGGDSGGGDECQAILDGCLADPLNFDPSCTDDYEACVQGQVDDELQGICDELEAECLASGLPVDCSTLCP